MSEGQAKGEADEAETAGVDVTLIDEMLGLSPAERLRRNDQMASLAARLREAFRLREGE
jgi:hypothetical protein